MLLLQPSLPTCCIPPPSFSHLSPPPSLSFARFLLLPKQSAGFKKLLKHNIQSDKFESFGNPIFFETHKIQMALYFIVCFVFISISGFYTTIDSGMFGVYGVVCVCAVFGCKSKFGNSSLEDRLFIFFFAAQFSLNMVENAKNCAFSLCLCLDQFT